MALHDTQNLYVHVQNAMKLRAHTPGTGGVDIRPPGLRMIPIDRLSVFSLTVVTHALYMLSILGTPNSGVSASDYDRTPELMIEIVSLFFAWMSERFSLTQKHRQGVLWLSSVEAEHDWLSSKPH